MITHPVLLPGRVAVVTGAGHGIGKAAAKEFARLGMKVAIADVNEERLNNIRRELADMIGEQNVDQSRILWSARDVAEGRPPLSRWHEDYRPMFQKFMDEQLSGKR